jgi:hypothetical protein
MEKASSPRTTITLHDGRSFTGFVVTDETVRPKGLLVVQWNEAVAGPDGVVSHVGFEVSALPCAIASRSDA